MDGKRIVKEGYNAMADKYLASRLDGSEDTLLLPEFAERLPDGGLVLDAGCGAGVPITEYLSGHFRPIGVDFSEQQVRLASDLVPGAAFTCQDMTDLGFPANTFHGICSYYAIIHIPRKYHQTVITNFYRVLRPGGVILVCMGAEDLEDNIEEDYHGVRMYWSHYDAKMNLQLIEARGFSVFWSKIVPDSTSPGSAHLFVLAQK